MKKNTLLLNLGLHTTLTTEKALVAEKLRISISWQQIIYLYLSEPQLNVTEKCLAYISLHPLNETMYQVFAVTI